MNELELLLERDRTADIPDPPDIRYTITAVRSRLNAAETAPGVETDRLLLIVAGGSVLISVSALLVLKLNPWWLVSLPLSALPLCPILLRKGAR